MRSLFKLSLAALLALVWAGTAMAIDIKFTGNVGTAFGQLTQGATADLDGDGNETDGAIVAASGGSFGAVPAEGADAMTNYSTSYEANLRWTIGGGPLTQVFRFRPRGTQSVSVTPGATAGDWNVADLYAETYWVPTEGLTVLFGRMQGGAWSSPLAGTYLIHNPIVTGSEYWMNWTGADGLDIEYNAGAFQVGVGVLAECKIGAACGTATNAAQQITPHASGKFGDISFRAMLPTASAKNATDDAVGGTGYQLGVAWAGAGFGVAFDVQSFTTGADTFGANMEDEAHTGMVFRADFAGFTLGYHTQAWNNLLGVDGLEASLTNIVVRYAIKVGEGTIYPEYGTSTKKGNSDGDAWTTSLIRLIGNTTF
jgi:hypothetical protein